MDRFQVWVKVIPPPNYDAAVYFPCGWVMIGFGASYQGAKEMINVYSPGGGAVVIDTQIVRVTTALK